MSSDHYLVIGNGPAGHKAAHTLREKAPDARVTLISKDHESCYRPRHLPDLIAGKIEEEALYECPIDSYKGKGIKLRSSQRVVDINLRDKQIQLDHKEILSFSGVIIAVGGVPRIPGPYDRFRHHLLTLKTIHDAEVWVDKLSRVDSILVMGGDLTSLAVTKALLQLKKKVYFMLNDDALWPIRCNDALFEDVAQKLSQRDVEVLQHRQLNNIDRLSNDAYEVDVEGRKIQVGIIGAFFGLTPDIQFLAGKGLRIDRGILVNQFLNTGFEGVYATGDCAQIYHPEIRDYWVSIGHENAVNLGHVAASNLAGEKVEAEVATESVFDVQGIKVNTSWWMEF